MAEKTVGSIRARVRAEVIEEIKKAARRQLATEGASLSLRAVARELGMASSALYRYFASRDELLTALIIDAYNSLGDVTELADARVKDRADLRARWLAVAISLRRWALSFPHEYALIYGSPVPGYAAPRDTVEPANRPVMVLGAILADARAAGVLSDRHHAQVPQPLRAEILQVSNLVGAGVPAHIMAAALIAWTELFGAISFELFGRIDNTINERDTWYAYQAHAMADLVGLP